MRASTPASPSTPSSAPRNVLLVTLDTTRADALADDLRGRTLAPRCAALADEGLRFARAYSVAPLTLPAHASLLTGLFPPRHGVHENGHAALSPAAETLAEALAGAGFETAAFVSALVLDRSFGLDQGFALYDQPELIPRDQDPEGVRRPARSTVAAAAAWLAGRDRARPFFLWVHLYDAHVPYEPDAAHLARAGGDPYRGAVAALDDAVGVLLDALQAEGAADATLVVLTADHGESRGEHGEPAHGALCYEATLRVPLVFRFPGAPPPVLPASLAEPVSLVDVSPSILAWLGLPAAPGVDGIDLFSPTRPPDRGLYFESYSGFYHYGWSPLAGWLDARGKYLQSSEPEYYLPLEDPDERHEVSASHPEECAHARAAMAELLARPSLAARTAPDDGELEAALIALGYARGETFEELPSPLAPSARPSPRSRTSELAPLLEAHALFQAGRFAECLEIVERLVHANPGHLLALDLEALCLMQAGSFRRAESVLRHRLALAEVADGRLNLGLCLLELGNPQGALREAETAQREAPEHPEVQAVLERVHRALGG